jgi:hypothetical protein
MVKDVAQSRATRMHDLLRCITSAARVTPTFSGESSELCSIALPGILFNAAVMTSIRDVFYCFFKDQCKEVPFHYNLS